MALLEAFRKYIADNDLATHDDRILLTVSGGVDSMVMLSLFTRSGYRIGVAHCNFQLRGAESDEDEVLVEEEARKYGVEFYNKRFETAAEMERTGESMEMAARRLRYAWFDALSREHGYTVVAIAHHADDSIETFFINLLRGTGLREGADADHPARFERRDQRPQVAVAGRVERRRLAGRQLVRGQVAAVVKKRQRAVVGDKMVGEKCFCAAKTLLKQAP